MFNCDKYLHAFLWLHWGGVGNQYRVGKFGIPPKPAIPNRKKKHDWSESMCSYQQGK